ncbi:delta-60 repeat domain-containing protein [Tundrisphaera sp. TA3]|uniref:delta-60 repeat domain-containing protein n=1 Tax=Tundrisphaera sp. TA3 TaxID=3435775 RepID=UPI003EBC1612
MLLSAGDFDPSFANGGWRSINITLGDRSNFLNYVIRSSASDLAVLPDGKILVAGAADQQSDSYFSEYYDFALFRLNADGTPDPTFGDGGLVSLAFDVIPNGRDVGAAVAIQPDGKIVVVGEAQVDRTDDLYSWMGNYDFAIARFLPDGAPDLTFGEGGKATIGFDLGGDGRDGATGVAILPDGKIVVSGTARSGASGSEFAAARLDAAGRLDPAFGVGGKATIGFDLGGPNDDTASGLAIQPDGKIVLAGTALGPGVAESRFALARLNAGGVLDPTFGDGGRVTVDFDPGGTDAESASALTLQSDGKIVAVGYTRRPGNGEGRFAIARLEVNGALDRSFGVDGLATVAFPSEGDGFARASSVAIQPDGRIVVGGGTQPTRVYDLFYAVARLDADGTIDSTFHDQGRLVLDIAYDPLRKGVSAVAVQPDGRIVAAGTSRVGIFGTQMIVARLMGGYDGLPEEPPPVPPVELPPVPPVEPPPIPPVDPDFPNIPYPDQGKDRVQPVVTSARPVFVGIGRRRRLAGFALTFSEPMHADAMVPDGFALGRVRRYRWGKAITAPARIVATAYDPATNTVTLATRRKAQFTRGATIAIRPGLADLSGNALRVSDAIWVR